MIQPGEEPIPGYRVERLLGRGQYGEVWQATSPGRSSVALKFLDMTGRGGWKEFRAVQRVKQIRHAHLMPIVALWLLDDEGQILTDDAVEDLAATESDTARTITAEALAAKPATRMVIATLLGDCSLRDRLDECLEAGQPGIPRDELLASMQEAAKGIDYLNSANHDWGGDKVGVQHCDIKPDNILLSGGSVMIADFGVAQLLAGEGGTRATSLSGSPAYMAPESFEAKPSNGSDQYSLAVTYYELRTGRLPVDPMNFAQAYDAHRTGSLDFSGATPEEIEVLRRATQPDASRRFPSTTEFVRALQGATHTAPPKKKSAAPWIATLAALLVAVGIGVAALLRDHSPEPPPTVVEPTPKAPQTASIALQFDVAETEVVVAGSPLKTDAQGKLNVEAEVGAPLTIAAGEIAGRKPKQWTIPAEEVVAGAEFKFALPRSAEEFADEAEALLGEGHLDEAVQVYAQAIEQAPDRYATLPQPVTRETAGLLWEDCLQVAPSGEALIAGGRDGVVRRWKIGPAGLAGEAEEVHRHEGGRVVSVAVAGGMLASAGDLSGIWFRKDGESQPLAKASPAATAETELAFTGDGRWLVAARGENLATRLESWDVEGAQPSATRITVGEQPGEFPLVIGVAGDSVVLATKESTAQVWRWRIETPRHETIGQQQNDVLTLVASASGEVVAYAGVASPGGGAGGQSDEAALVDLRTKTRFPLTAPQADSILASALDQEGKRLATAERSGGLAESGTVWLWRPDRTAGVAVAERALEYDRDAGDVTTLAISTGNHWLAAGHTSGAVSLWNLATEAPTPALSFGKGDRVAAVRITPNGRWLFAATRDGRLTALDLWRLEMVKEACARANVEPRAASDPLTFWEHPISDGAGLAVH